MKLDNEPNARTLMDEMKTLKQLATATICIASVTLLSSALSAYEQGTYFIYDLVEKLEDTTVAKRLAVESHILVEPATVTEPATPEIATSSEFEIDFTSLGTSSASSPFTTDSSFENGIPTKSESSVFDLIDSTSSVFEQ